MSVVEQMVEDMRNAKRGFGCYIANDRDNGIDLYGETDNGERMIVAWEAGTYRLYREGQPTIIASQGDFATQKMLEIAYEYGSAIEYDDVSTGEGEEYWDAIETYEETTEKAVGITR